MNQDTHIIIDKELRRDIDGIIQRIKCASDKNYTGLRPPDAELRGSRERSIAITKLQESVMWLGMDLKAINDENRPSEEAVEAEAKVIYEHNHCVDERGRYRPWVDAGNSLKQDEARKEARAKLGLVPDPYPNSKDPSNTTIEPTADGLKL